MAVRLWAVAAAGETLQALFFERGNAMNYQLSHDQLCDLNILAGKIQAAGDLLNFWTPSNDFPNSGEGFFMDLGQGLSEAALQINRMTLGLEKVSLAERKDPNDLMGHFKSEIERLTSERDGLREELQEARQGERRP